MTISAGSTILHSDLNTDADQQRSGLTAQAQARAKDLQVDVVTKGLTSATALPARSRLFTPDDDYEVRALGIMVSGGAAARVLTVTVTSPDGSEYLLEQTVSKAHTCAGAGIENSRVDYETTTGTRIFLVKGVQYQIAISSDAAGATTVVQGILYLRARARPRAGRALAPVIFRSGDTLDPDRVNLLQEGLSRDLERSIDQRYTTSLFFVPFDDLDFATDGSGEKELKIKAPLAYDIVNVEWYVASAADTYTLACTASGFTSVAATATGTAAYVRATDSFVAHVNANTEITFSVTSSGTGTLTSGYAVIHIRHDRHAAAPPATHTPLNLKSGVVTSAADWNTSFNAYDADATADANNNQQLRIYIHHVRNDAAGTLLRLPASSRRLHTMDMYCVSVGIQATVDILDEVSSTLASVAATGTNADTTVKNQGTALGLTQAQNDPDDAADDWTSNVFPAAGTLLKAYAVLYWT